MTKWVCRWPNCSGFPCDPRECDPRCSDDQAEPPGANPPRFPNTFCSQCGAEFGPGDHGYSHCQDHRKASRDPDRLYQELLAMARSGHVDFTLLDDPALLQREHQRDKDQARLDQEDWDAEHWRMPE